MNRLLKLVRHPLFGPLVVGLSARTVAALWGYGYFAADDVRYVLQPAFTWLTDPAHPYFSDIRSPLLARGFWLTMELGQTVGLTTPVGLLRFGYLALGLYSLLAIPAVYAFTARTLGQRAAVTAAWLVAAEALMPRMSTRALISIAALPPITAGFACAARADETREMPSAILAGVLLAFGSMIRFQAGLLYVGLFAFFVYRAWRTQSGRPLLGLFLGGAVGA
ncbi:MAG: glycosyltransferase family 39 protein, partial [Myxococcota bacterium]